MKTAQRSLAASPSPPHTSCALSPWHTPWALHMSLAVSSLLSTPGATRRPCHTWGCPVSDDPDNSKECWSGALSAPLVGQVWCFSRD